MFGHHDSNDTNTVAPAATPTTDGIISHPAAPQMMAPTAGTPAIAAPSDSGNNDYVMTDLTATQPAQQAVATAAEPAPANIDAVSSPAPAPAPSAPAVDTGLLELKMAALHELSPLIDHLEQTADEKFRTMMMMIQASDDQSLLAEAYQAALGIEDKKVRAQALLDVVNEINYFTQHQDGAQS
jgi:hypothetical protein